MPDDTPNLKAIDEAMAAELMDDGGCAFPQPLSFDTVGNWIAPAAYGMGGISVRDYFAAQAMSLAFSDISENGTRMWGEKDVATLAYKVADAMLVERKRS